MTINLHSFCDEFMKIAGAAQYGARAADLGDEMVQHLIRGVGRGLEGKGLQRQVSLDMKPGVQKARGMLDPGELQSFGASMSDSAREAAEMANMQRGMDFGSPIPALLKAQVAPAEYQAASQALQKQLFPPTPTGAFQPLAHAPHRLPSKMVRTGKGA